MRAGLVLLIVSLFLVGGCAAHYVAPGGPADLKLLAPEASADDQTPFSIAQALERRPTATFPANVMIVRVQAPQYRSYTAATWGQGNYCIVTTRDIETDEQFETLAELPQVAGLAPANRMLFPARLTSDRELREAAARVQAGMVLVYTIDTDFFIRDMAAPLSVVTLGLSPNQKAYVTTTASALLMDTRTGYVYGLAEATERTERLASAWTNGDAVDAARLKTESAAFDKLVGELAQTWTGVVARYAVADAPAAK